MPSYKLTYFNGRGRAEAARLLFAAAGVAFEDVRLNREQWMELKPKVKLGILPSLEVDGQSFTQSRAIVYYLAKEFGFYPSSNIEGFKVDEVLFIIEDFFQAAIKVRFAPEDKKEELGKEFTATTMPKYMGWLETILKDRKTAFFCGDKMSVADIVVYDFIFGLNTRHADCLKGYPLIQAVVDKVANEPKIKSYVDKRPDSEF